MNGATTSLFLVQDVKDFLSQKGQKRKDHIKSFFIFQLRKLQMLALSSSSLSPRIKLRSIHKAEDQ